MAAISNATTITTMAAAIPDQMIAAIVQHGVQSPRLVRVFAYTPPVVNSAVYDHPVFPELTAAAAHTETDEFASASITPTVNSITCAAYGKASFLSDRSQVMSPQQLGPIAVKKVVDACMLRVETSACAVATSMTNFQGDNATVNDLSNLNSVMAAYRTQAKQGSNRPVIVMSNEAMRDLGDALANSASAVYGGAAGQELAQAVLSPNLGLVSYMGFVIGVTDLLPAGDTSGKSNFIVSVGPAECGIAVPFLRPLKVEIGRVAERDGEWVVGIVDFGAGIVDQARCYKFITRA